MKIQVFDPAMCCSTGVCGTSVDPELVRFAADIDWLASHDVEVERYNLAQQPAAFAETPLVKEALTNDGTDCLPLLVGNGAVLSKGRYPTRQELARYAGLQIQPSIFTEAIRELVAIGAAIGANCEPCFKYHYDQARKLGVSEADMLLAVEMAQKVKEAPARSILNLANRILKGTQPQEGGGCGDAETPASAGKCCG